MTAAPYCPHQPECTGCPLSHLEYPEQLSHKARGVASELERWPALEGVRPSPPLGANPTQGYRSRVKLVHRDGRLGLFTPGHDVVDTIHCRVQHPTLSQTLDALRERLPLPVNLLAVDASLANDGVLLTLVVTPDTSPDVLKETASALLDELPHVKGVAYSHRAVDSPRVLGSAPVPLIGKSELRQAFAPGEPYHLAVFGGFVQAHGGQAFALHNAITDILRTRFTSLQGLDVVELYAGAGSLALHLAALGVAVTAVESYAPSVALLEKTAAAQHLSVRALAESAESALLRLNKTSDAIIVDPPRRGLSVEVREAMGRTAAKLVVYVSCEPSTLARDLSHLAWLGYRTSSVLPVDMIPFSSAIEALVVLEPALAPPLEILFRDETLLVVNKPPHIPTTPHPEHSCSLLSLVQRLPGCERAAPVHRLDAGTSGVCLFAVHPGHAEQLGKELAEGQKTYTAVAQGITNKRGTIRKTLLEGRQPRAAETRYVRTGVAGTHSLVHAFPVHGRKHQIRRHFAAVGHPLLGDAKYAKGGSARYFFERHGLDRPFLHCGRIEITHGSRALQLDAPLAPDLSRVLDALTSGASHASRASWDD